MRQKRRPAHDPIEAAIEAALCPGEFINYNASWSFVDALHGPESAIEELIKADPPRAVRLYETFLAGCYEKANELDDSSGSFGMLVDDLFAGWIKSRQAMGADPDETAAWLLARMDDDPWGFAYHLERDAAKVMNKANLAAFSRQVRRRFEGEPAEVKDKPRDAQYARRRWGEVLRAIHAAQNDVSAYVALCEETEMTAQDCLAVATLLRAKQPEEALTWVDRGLDLDKKHPHGSMARHDLTKLKRELLTRVGRAGDALEDAWAEFRRHPSKYTYQDVMRFVPKAERAAWHAKAMETTAAGDLGSMIKLWLETKEIDRLVERLRRAKNADLEAISHYTTEPAAKRLAKSHPAVAAKGDATRMLVSDYQAALMEPLSFMMPPTLRDPPSAHVIESGKPGQITLLWDDPNGFTPGISWLVCRGATCARYSPSSAATATVSTPASD